MASKFDFVIIGGGTAGVLLASRLSEDPDISVLVLEAGEDLLADPRVNMPMLWTQLQGSSADWNFRTVSQRGLGGRQITIPQGRLLGGSGALNCMNFAVSSRENIDAWADLGNEGWNWSSVSQALGDVVSLTTPSGAENGGPVQIAVPEEDNKWLDVWKETIAGLGYPADNSNPLSGDIIGAFSCPDAINPTTKLRSCSANTIFQQARDRPNLTVWSQVLVEKIILEKTPDGDAIATGVQYTKDGQSHTVQADKEVVLSAGVFGSPKILELSGIGDKTHLQSLDIEPIIDNPHVGENLQVHPVAVLVFETIDHANDPDFWTMDKIARQDPTALAAAMEAYSRQTGPLSKTNINAMAYLPFPNLNSEQGKVTLSQILSSPTFNTDPTPSNKTTPPFASAHKSYIHSTLQNAPSAQYISFPGWATYDPSTGLIDPVPPPSNPSATYYTVGIILSHPLSRGSTHITTDSDALEIDPNQLTHPLDAEILAHHVHFLHTNLSKSHPLSSHLKGPVPNRGGPQEETLDSARKWVKENSVLTAHFTSTCSMLPQGMGGVVNPELKVYGTKNLRVCDASIMPLTTRGNTMATVYALAEKGAGIIKASYAGKG